MSWKVIGKKLLFPPGWLLLLLNAVSAAGLGWVFRGGMQEHPVSCAVYGISFYTLTADCVFCAGVLPKRYDQMKRKMDSTALGRRYMTDRAFRTEISLYLSLSVGLAYVLINLVNWYFSRSWWFATLAIYYTIMSFLRFLMVRYVHRNTLGEASVVEWKLSKLCACCLLLINLSLSGAVLMILYQDRGYRYPGMMIYALALYTFYSTISSIVSLVKFRRFGSPILSAAKIVGLCAALVSMLNLETAMFDQFGGEMSIEKQRIFIILTGAGVSAAVVTMSVGLILRANREIRRRRNGS